MGIVTRTSGMMKVLKAVKKRGLEIECTKFKLGHYSFLATGLNLGQVAEDLVFSYTSVLQYYKALCKVMERLSSVDGREWNAMKVKELLANSEAMEMVVFGKEDIDWK